MKDKVSVLVLNHNGIQHLEECLNSLKNQTYPHYEVVIVDNCSTDSSIEFIRTRFPWVRIIALDKNYGPAEGYNIAIGMVDSEYVALLNNDTWVEPNWLSELVKAMEQDDAIAVCGSKVMLYGQDGIINSAGEKITIVGAGYDIGLGERDSKPFNEPRYVGSVLAAAMLVRSKVFNELGGYDGYHFIFLEELDLCWRAWLYGYKVRYVPSSIVYHKFGATTGRRHTPFRVFHGVKNRLANMVKNLETKNVLKGAIVSLIYEAYRILTFARQGNFPAARAIWDGFYYFMRHIREILDKRKVIQRNRRITDAALYRLGLMASLAEAYQEYTRLEKLEAMKHYG